MLTWWVWPSYPLLPGSRCRLPLFCSIFLQAFSSWGRPNMLAVETDYYPSLGIRSLPKRKSEWISLHALHYLKVSYKCMVLHQDYVFRLSSKIGSRHNLPRANSFPYASQGEDDITSIRWLQGSTLYTLQMPKVWSFPIALFWDLTIW